MVLPGKEETTRQSLHASGPSPTLSFLPILDTHNSLVLHGFVGTMPQSLPIFAADLFGKYVIKKTHQFTQ